MYYQLKAVMDMELHSMVTLHIHPQMEWQQMIDLIVRHDDSLRMKKNRQSNNYPQNNFNNKSAHSPQNQRNLGTTNLTRTETRNSGYQRRYHLSKATTGNRRTIIKRKGTYQTSHISTATKKDTMLTNVQKKRKQSPPLHNHYTKGQLTKRNH